VQGVIYDELEKFVSAQLGEAGLTRIRNLTGRGDRGYDFAASYPDDELTVIMRGLVEATGRPPEDLVEEFGVAIVPGLLEIYGFLINPRWSFMDFLLNTEGVIHSGVKLNTPNARPPELEAIRNGPDSVTIRYHSKRGLCPLARGIIRGAAAHYRVEVAITEARCMLRGDPECLITVSGEE
jgi:hypothetical protein